MVRTATYLFSYPELNLQAEGLPVSTAHILTMWSVASALLGQPHLLPRKEAGETSREITPLLLCSMRRALPPSCPSL